tara:strand:- start:14361 stop:14903 length:543 start_codon:yes stop_codon:yes gene_type:complete
MSKKLIIDWEEYNTSIDKLAIQISDSGFIPTFIICIARGGVRVGDILSRIFNVKCGYLGVESYSASNENEVADIQNKLTFARDLSTTSKNYGNKILVTDDLIDTGVTLEKTLSWLKNYKDFINQDINFRTAVLYKKEKSEFNSDYIVHNLKDNPWIVFPYELRELITIENLKKELSKKGQ